MPTPSLTSSPPPAARPARKKWRQRFKRVGFGALGLLAILIIAFFLLPQWISNAQGRTYVLDRLNHRMRGKLAVEDWSLGWFGGTELHGVSLTLPDGTTLLASPLIRSDLTLWNLLWGRYDVGTTTITSPTVTLTKRANGSTSLDEISLDGRPLFSRKALDTLRGSLQFSKGTVTLKSEKAHEQATWHDCSGTLSIASPDAPLHAQCTGVSPEGTISLNVSTPPARMWRRANWPEVIINSDIEFTGTSLLTAAVCDWACIDPRWADSFGRTLSRVSLSNHAAYPSDTSTLSVQIVGATADRAVDAAIQAHAASLHSPATFVLPDVPGPYRARVSLPMSPPLINLLRQINPLFGQVVSGEGNLQMTVGELHVNSARPAETEWSGRLFLPPLQFGKGGLLAQLVTLPVADGRRAVVDPLRVRYREGKVSYENLTVTFSRRQRIIFQGSVVPYGPVHLTATVPDQGAADSDSLQTVTADLPITGTVDHPVVNAGP